MKKYAIILASGLGLRYGANTPKQFVKVAGKTILEHTIDIFEKNNAIDEIFIVIAPQFRNTLLELLLKLNCKKITKILNGGETRKDSSYVGISAIKEDDAYAIIHDCARPLLSQSILNNCILALKDYDAVDVAIPATDTIIEVNENNLITTIPERSKMRRGQTPQCFKASLIKRAHELSKHDNDFTDDCGLVVKNNLAPVYVVEGESKNIKITMPEDIYLLDKLFQISNTKAQTIDKQDLKDKVFVIFGGNSGIGECLIKLSSQYDYKAYSFSRQTGCDISSYNDVIDALKEVYDKEGKINYIINCAAILKTGKLETREILDIENEVSINYIGNINVCKAGIEYLKKTQGCFLLFTSSSYTRGRALYSTYSSAKSAVVNLVQALAEELEYNKVRINAINPERTATPMRTQNFGIEPAESLLSPEKVAITCLDTLLSSLTGQVFDVRR